MKKYKHGNIYLVEYRQYCSIIDITIIDSINIFTYYDYGKEYKENTFNLFVGFDDLNDGNGKRRFDFATEKTILESSVIRSKDITDVINDFVNEKD